MEYRTTVETVKLLRVEPELINVWYSIETEDTVSGSNTSIYQA